MRDLRWPEDDYCASEGNKWGISGGKRLHSRTIGIGEDENDDGNEVDDEEGVGITAKRG